MPELDDDDFDGTQPDESDEVKQANKAAYRARKLERENSDLKAQLQVLQRQTAFTSAGLSLSEKQQAALLAAHGESDLTADALRATATELGFLQPDTAADQQREDAAQAQARVGQAQAGSQPPEPVPDLDQQIFSAEQSNDWATAAQLKAAKVAQQMFG